MAKQGFGPPSDTPEKGRGYHGFARYFDLSPDVAQKGVKSLNVNMTMEEVLKLRLALDSCALNQSLSPRHKEREIDGSLSVIEDGHFVDCRHRNGVALSRKLGLNGVPIMRRSVAARQGSARDRLPPASVSLNGRAKVLMLAEGLVARVTMGIVAAHGVRELHR